MGSLTRCLATSQPSASHNYACPIMRIHFHPSKKKKNQTLSLVSVKSHKSNSVLCRCSVQTAPSATRGQGGQSSVAGLDFQVPLAVLSANSTLLGSEEPLPLFFLVFWFWFWFLVWVSFFFFFGCAMAYGSSWARDQTQATAVTRAWTPNSRLPGNALILSTSLICSLEAWH